MTPAHEDWIFAYGSLMWRPGFRYLEAQRAQLTGYRRCFSVYSIHHRGTRARPGLVLGLDRGGACAGMAFRIAPEDAGDIRAYLKAREQVEGVYRAALLPVELMGERRMCTALAFIVERSHVNYAGRLPVAAQARIIASAAGISGTNTDYLINTLAHLDEMGIAERELKRVMALVGPVAGRASQHVEHHGSIPNGGMPYVGMHGRASSCAMQRALRERPPLVEPRRQKEPGRRFLYRMQA